MDRDYLSTLHLCILLQGHALPDKYVESALLSVDQDTALEDIVCFIGAFWSQNSTVALCFFMSDLNSVTDIKVNKRAKIWRSSFSKFKNQGHKQAVPQSDLTQSLS